MKKLIMFFVILLAMPAVTWAAEGDPPPPLPTPTAPTGLVATNITQTSVDLSWHDNPPDEEVTNYNIYKDGIFLTSKTNTSYTVSNLEPGTEYQFYVTAENISGEGPASDVLLVTTASALAPPTNLRATNIGATSISIIWDGSAPEYEVNVYDGLTHEVAGQTTGTTYTITGLESEKEYDIYVVAIYDSGKSEASNILSIKLGAPPVPTSVEGIVGASFPYIKMLVPFLVMTFAIGATFLIMENLPVVFGRRRY